MSFASTVSVSENKFILNDYKNCKNNRGKEEEKEEEYIEIIPDSQQQ